MTSDAQHGARRPQHWGPPRPALARVMRDAVPRWAPRQRGLSPAPGRHAPPWPRSSLRSLRSPRLGPGSASPRLVRSACGGAFAIVPRGPAGLHPARRSLRVGGPARVLVLARGLPGWSARCGLARPPRPSPPSPPALRVRVSPVGGGGSGPVRAVAPRGGPPPGARPLASLGVLARPLPPARAFRPGRPLRAPPAPGPSAPASGRVLRARLYRLRWLQLRRQPGGASGEPPGRRRVRRVLSGRCVPFERVASSLCIPSRTGG